MNDSILAPIQILDMFVTDIMFHIEQSPADSMTMHVREDHRYSVPQKTEDGLAYMLNMDMDVSATLSDTNDPDDIRAQAGASVHISVAVPSDIDKSGIDCDSYLKANALSMAYGHARSCIMTLAGMSPMTSFILPPVLPYSMLDEDQTES